jgi:hypothetical protein
MPADSKEGSSVLGANRSAGAHGYLLEVYLLMASRTFEQAALALDSEIAQSN